MKIYVLLIYLVHCVTGEAVTSLGLINDETKVQKSCTVERVYKMVGYVCSNLNLKEIPQHLRSGLEVSQNNYSFSFANRSTCYKLKPSNIIYIFE